MWKYLEVNSHAYLQVIYGNSGGQTEENHEEPYNSHCPGQDLNQEYTKYKSQPLLFKLISSERLRSCSSWGRGILKGLTCFMKSTLVGLPYWYEGKCMLAHVEVEMHTKSKDLKGRDIIHSPSWNSWKKNIIMAYTNIMLHTIHHHHHLQYIPHTWCAQSQLFPSVLVTHCHSCNWLFISLLLLQQKKKKN